jgi:hypothetical protein
LKYGKRCPVTLRLYDPVSEIDVSRLSFAPRLQSLAGLKIGLLANGKAKSDVLARETARFFTEAYGAEVVADENKGNASRPCPPDLLRSLAERSDLLITAVGD